MECMTTISTGDYDEDNSNLIFQQKFRWNILPQIFDSTPQPAALPDSTMTPLSSRFSYFPSLFFLVFAEYVILMIAFGLYRYYSCCCRPCCKKSPIAKDNLTMRFEDSYESISPCFQYLLLATRILSLGYILGVGVIGSYARNANIWFFFTFWNLELESIYFILAMSCSIVGLRKNKIAKARSAGREDLENGQQENEEVTWPSAVVGLGKATQVFLEVCGGTAFLVTVVDFVLLDPRFSFWNVTQHFVTSLALVVDLSLSNMEVRLDHFTYNISWSMLYVIFIWPLVILGHLGNFPYFFLALDTKACYGWYTAFIAINVGFYALFYGFSKLKFFVRKCMCCKSKAAAIKVPSAQPYSPFKSAVTGVAEVGVSDRKIVI